MGKKHEDTGHRRSKTVKLELLAEADRDDSRSEELRDTVKGVGDTRKAEQEQRTGRVAGEVRLEAASFAVPERLLQRVGEEGNVRGVSDEVARIVAVERQLREHARSLSVALESATLPSRDSKKVAKMIATLREVANGTNDLVDMDTAAQMLGLTRPMVKKHAQAGRIGKLVGGQYAFSARELEHFDKTRKKTRGPSKGSKKS